MKGGGEQLSCLSRGDRVANSSSSLLTGYSTSRSDPNFGSTPLFQHAPRHTPLPPSFRRRTLRAEAPPPLCDSSARRLPPGPGAWLRELNKQSRAFTRPGARAGLIYIPMSPTWRLIGRFKRPATVRKESTKEEKKKTTTGEEKEENKK